ncbi:MAG: hypothetical protein N4J56_007101 [Chroococcidiopsis sp. SAG 2025]|nr:hypothetical protein [Chroococcidiopsis sp. SAG 2025]
MAELKVTVPENSQNILGTVTINASLEGSPTQVRISCSDGRNTK